jgi:hypothetical protein
MYMLDPSRGRTRRARVRDKAVSYYHSTEDVAGRTVRDVKNRAYGVAATTRSMWKNEEVSDEKLLARIRSKLGRYVSHPSAIDVTASNGEVTLRGPVLRREASRFIRAVSGIPGVKGVRDELDVHDTAGTHPSLQGEGYRGGSEWDLMQTNWSPTTRLMASALGGGLLVYGMKGRSKLAKATATFGLGLLTRGITNREVASLTNLGSARRLVGL